MAKYDVIQKVSGNISVVSTWDDNKNGAKQAAHHQCESLYADKNTTTAVVEILDDNLNVVDGCRFYIDKTE